MLIIDMPMPRGCAECPLKTFGGACMIPVFGNGVNYKPFEERPDWCPIKGELPEQHGDLVDADTVLWGEEVPDSEGIVVPVTIGDVINGYDVPIVITAERKDDGRTDKA